MANANLLLTLAKVIIAAAWADGQVALDEINSLKDLLFRLPNITGREWAMLEMYIEAPIGPTERARLLEQLQNELRTTADKALAIQALEDLIQADGEITEEEQLVAEEIKSAIETADVGVVGAFSRLIRGPVSRRTQIVQDAPNREVFFEDFIKNKVFYEIRRRLAIEEKDLKLVVNYLTLENAVVAFFDEKDNLNLGTLAVAVPQFASKPGVSSILLGE